MDEVLLTVVQISVLVFVVSSMLAMGLSLTVPEIIEPLRNVRLVVSALVVNFVVVPLVVILIQAVMDPDDDIYTGLVILTTAAGAPFLPKLAQAAKGSVAFSVGLMVMLKVVTVAYMPAALVIAGRSFSDTPDVITTVMVAALLGLVILLPLAGELGKRSAGATASSSDQSA